MLTAQIVRSGALEHLRHLPPLGQTARSCALARTFLTSTNPNLHRITSVKIIPGGGKKKC
jgi:hypothetical protein